MSRWNATADHGSVPLGSARTECGAPVSYPTRGAETLRYNAPHPVRETKQNKTNVWSSLRATSRHANSRELQGTYLHSPSMGPESQRHTEKGVTGMYKGSESKGDVTNHNIYYDTLNGTRRKPRHSFCIPGSAVALNQSNTLQEPSVPKFYIGRCRKNEDTEDSACHLLEQERLSWSGGRVPHRLFSKRKETRF